MKKIGLTGGIGSGKTTVSKVFAALGVPIFYADEAGRAVLNDDKEVRRAVIKLLGITAYKDGRADRKEMANMVFRHPESLDALTAIVHPAVARSWQQFLARHASADYVMKEAAILFESGSHEDMTKVVAVAAPEELRMQRVQARDGSTREEVLDRMRNQLSEAERNERADYLIFNDESQPILEQVAELDRLLRKL